MKGSDHTFPVRGRVMSKKHRRPQSNDAHGVDHRIEHLQLELFVGVLVLLAFTCLKRSCEHTSVGHWMSEQTHFWWQTQIRPASGDLPVTVVDISGLPRES